ncbi:MAG: Uma2 family endonuclease [Chloroflexota bacterium]
MSQRAGVAIALSPVMAWPPDDTEESVVGTNLHQEAIGTLKWGLNELASALALPDGQQPWHAFMQTTIAGWRHSNGVPYTTLPDLYVYRQALDLCRSSLSLELDGPPLLVIEVLSPITYRADLDLEHGKGYSYARGGALEYLTLGPAGEFADYRAEQGRAWRLEGDVYRPWRPDRRGRWRSLRLGVVIGLEGVQVAVYDRHGRRQLHEGEVHRELARRDEEIARRGEELARRDEELADLRRRLKELGQQ